MLQNQDIICISGTYWDAPWLSVHQYMSRLARHNRVMFVERPVTLLSYLNPGQRAYVTRQLGRWIKGSVHQDERGVYIAAPPPVFPPRFEQPVNAINQFIRATWARQTAAKIGFKNPILWIYDVDAARMVNHVDEAFSLYFITDDHATSHAFRSQRFNRLDSMRAREQELAAACDLVIATAQNLADSKRPYNASTYCVQHGVDSDHFAQAARDDFAPAPEMANFKAPVIGIVGQINQRIDIDLMQKVAAAHPEWTLVFIGPLLREKVDVTGLESLPNVHFLGRKSVADLPRYLKAMSVCVIPYLVNEHTTYMHPLKTLEYLAAGKPVVSTPLPTLTIYQDYITLAQEPGAFIAAIENALAGDSPHEQARRTAYALKHSWESRLEDISALITSKLEAVQR